MINEILLAYGALVIALLIHEIGHIPKKIAINILIFSISIGPGFRFNIKPADKLYLIPMSSAIEAGYFLSKQYNPVIDTIARYGGIAINYATAYYIAQMTNPSTFLILIGIFSFIHFILYTTLGCYNQEVYIVNGVKSMVYDDVPNNMKCFFIPLAILVWLQLGPFYQQYLWPIPALITAVWLIESKIRS